MFKAVDKWLPGYLGSMLRRPGRVEGTRHLMVCLCDHFEPFRDGASPDVALQTVRDWLAEYPRVTDAFRDADGRSPRHTFFYPREEYNPAILDSLGAFCRQGHGEVEVHLHHRHDTPAGFREKLMTFRDLLHKKHGLLGEEKSIQQKHTKIAKEEDCIAAGGGETNPSWWASCASVQDSASPSPVRYAFIHGNWALCNSRPDGDWCGVNGELSILAETGCYADFTFPSAPSPTQPRMVNALYYASDRPGKPRGADWGMRCRMQDPGCRIQHPASSIQDPPPAQLLMITGPLALNWRRRKWRLLPRLENAELSGVNPPGLDRIRLWARQPIHVTGRPDWVFVKLHTHGCVPANARMLLGDAMRGMHDALHREFNDGERWQLHYVTARELYNLVKAAEANLPGPPGQYRDTPILWRGR